MLNCLGLKIIRIFRVFRVNGKMQTRQNSAKPTPGVTSEEVARDGALNTAPLGWEKLSTFFYEVTLIQRAY